MFTSYLSKGLYNICKVLVFTFVLSSCVKNTYFNSRAIVPVFTDSSCIHAEAYVGQGIRQIGGNLSLAPIRQGFVTGAYNKGAGYTWEAGLGCIPFKRNNLLVTVLSTYGKGHVDYSYVKDIPFQWEENTNIDTKYEKYSSTVFVKFKEYGDFFICLGLRYNFVQYFNYKEHKRYYRDIRRSVLYKREESLSFDNSKNFHTFDPFIDFNCRANKYISFSFQTLYSISNKFKMHGQGYNKTYYYHQSNEIIDEYTYTTNIPQYKRLVLNFALVVHLAFF